MDKLIGKNIWEINNRKAKRNTVYFRANNSLMRIKLK